MSEEVAQFLDAHVRQNFPPNEYKVQREVVSSRARRVYEKAVLGAVKIFRTRTRLFYQDLTANGIELPPVHQQLAEEVSEPQAAVDAEAQLRVLEQQLIERNQELERAVERFNRNRPTGSHDSDIEYDDSSRESFSSGSYSEESDASSSDDDEVISDESKSTKRKAPEEVETSQAKKTKTDSETITNDETVGTDGTESKKRKSPTEEADTSQSKKAKTVTE
jgi:hypothetical protein